MRKKKSTLLPFSSKGVLAKSLVLNGAFIRKSAPRRLHFFVLLVVSLKGIAVFFSSGNRLPASGGHETAQLVIPDYFPKKTIGMQ